MLRRKSPAQRIIAGILSFTMILWTVAPSTVILAQPVTVPPLGAPTFQTTDFDPYFAAANQSSSETGWEQTVAQAKAVLAAQWEIQAETQIQGHLAGISTSDAFNTVTEYRDYLRKELEIQKQSSRSQWELAAEVSIASNRDTFLTALVNRQYDQTTQQGQSYVSAGNAAADAGVQSQIDAARQQFEATFNAGVNQSLNEYNVALAQIQAEAEAFLIELQQADQQFQANLQAIEVYETNVRTGIQGASTQLRNQLNTNGMFYVQNCDAQNQCTADMGQMTAAGQTLQTLLASIDNGLATNVPLSTLATQLTTYLQNRETAATTERDTWDAAIYENRTGSNAQRLGYGLDYAAYQANDPIVHGVLQYLRFGSTAELTGLLGSGHRTAQDFSGVELLGWSVAHIPYPVTANSFRKNQRWVADGVGESALTYDAVGCGGPPPICLTNPFAPFGVNGWGEQFVDVQYSYRMYDPNAENNRDVWQQYAGDINLEYTAWNGTLLPALQSWETQVAQYEANYSAWQTQRAAVEQQNLQAFQQKRDAILTDRNQYLSRVQAAYRDGLAQFGNLEKQLAAEATAAAAESAKNSTANGATASGGVDANFILQNGLQNAAGYTRALGNPRNAARILEAANSRVTAQVDGSFLERGQISGPNLELPRDLLSSFNKTLNGTFGIAVVEQQNQDAKDAQKQATSDLVAMLNKLTADTSVSDRELHASLVGMMDYKITEDTDIMSIELDWEKLEVKDQAEFDKLKENVRKSIEDSKKRKQFKSVELQDDGRIKITRDVSTGSSVLRAGGDALNAEDYVQVMREDTFYVEGSGALKLATTPGLFSAEFDVNETIHNFEASRAEFEQGIQKLFGDTNNRVEAENSAMEALHRRGKQDAQAQAELANQMVDLAKSLIMGGTVASWIQGQINGKVSALIEEATGLPAGFISGMLGGMKPHQALQSYVEGQMYAAIDTAFGLPAGVFSHLASQHKAEQKRKNDPNRKMMRDMVNFYTGAWIPGNPLKGQLNKLADKVGDYAQKNPMVIDAIGMATGTYWMTKAVQGGYKGGALGAGAELVSGGLTAAGIVFTAGTVDANVSYTYEDGWAGDVSVGVGVAPFRASAGVGYSDKGGLSANLGVTAGFGSSGLALGVNWSENEGFGGFAGVTLADGAVSLGVGYSKREGFGGFVGAGDLQVSYSERAGFGAGLSMAHQSSGVGLDFKITEKLGTTVGMNYGQSVGNGASVSGGVSYNTQTGMSANANISVDPTKAGFADESDMAGKFQGNGNTVNMGMSWSEEDGLGVSGPSASRQYITSLDGLQSTVAGQARALRAAALLKDEAAYLNSLDKNITEKEWLAMPEEQRQAIRDANKDRTSNERFGNLTDAEQKGRGLEAREGFFSQAGGMVSDSLLSVIGTNSSQAGYVDEAGKFVPRVGNAPTGTGFSLATTWEKTKNFITFNGFSTDAEIESERIAAERTAQRVAQYEAEIAAGETARTIGSTYHQGTTTFERALFLDKIPFVRDLIYDDVESQAIVLDGDCGGAKCEKTIVLNHGLMTGVGESGNGVAGVEGLIGKYYSDLDIEQLRSQGYNVVFVNSNGNASNAASAAMVMDQLGQYLDANDGVDIKLSTITHSRGAHDQLGIQTMAYTTTTEGLDMLNRAGYSDPQDIARLTEYNQRIVEATKGLELTSPALRGPQGQPTVADSSYSFPSNALSYVADIFIGTRSDGVYSMTSSQQAEYERLYQSAQPMNIPVGMHSGSAWQMSASKGGETFMGSILGYGGQTPNDGAVTVAGQTNSILVGGLNRGGQESVYVAPVQGLNHAQTADSPIMMRQVLERFGVPYSVPEFPCPTAPTITCN